MGKSKQVSKVLNHIIYSEIYKRERKRFKKVLWKQFKLSTVMTYDGCDVKRTLEAEHLSG